jgi:hypothetical protein
VPSTQDDEKPDTAEQDALRHRAAELERELDTVRARLSAADGKVSSRTRAATTQMYGLAMAADLAEPASAGDATTRRPFRGLVLDSLDDLNVLAYSRELTLYVQARYGRRVTSSRFGSLAADEQRTFTAGRPRSVYLTHALTAQRGEAIKRLWGRSDWPLEDRIVAPTTGRVQHLKVTAALARLAMDEPGGDSGMLKILAADHARDLPGAKVRRGAFDLDEWRIIAEGLLTELEGRDHELRIAAATHLAATLTAREQLFGADETTLFVVPDAVAHEGGDA